MQKTNAKMDGAIFNIHIKTSQIDLDPTTNDDLHIHAWKQLVGKIEKKKKKCKQYLAVLDIFSNFTQGRSSRN
jgi:hypothetical protein